MTGFLDFVNVVGIVGLAIWLVLRLRQWTLSDSGRARLATWRPAAFISAQSLIAAAWLLAAGTSPWSFYFLYQTLGFWSILPIRFVLAAILILIPAGLIVTDSALAPPASHSCRLDAPAHLGDGDSHLRRRDSDDPCNRNAIGDSPAGRAGVCKCSDDAVPHRVVVLQPPTTGEVARLIRLVASVRTGNRRMLYSVHERDVSLTRELARRSYTIERLIGHGGMATVHLAEEKKHRRKVAIKVLKQEFGASVGAERFLREIGIAARLSHPHIVPLIDSGESEGSLYYVSPFIPGGSLRDRLNREKKLPVDDALRIAHEVGSALDYAHRNGFVHRDVKPENILFADDHALLADFGIAHVATRRTASRSPSAGSRSALRST